jgi:hypothetical protein
VEGIQKRREAVCNGKGIMAVLAHPEALSIPKENLASVLPEGAQQQQATAWIISDSDISLGQWIPERSLLLFVFQVTRIPLCAYAVKDAHKGVPAVWHGEAIWLWAAAVGTAKECLVIGRQLDPQMLF